MRYWGRWKNNDVPQANQKRRPANNSTNLVVGGNVLQCNRMYNFSRDCVVVIWNGIELKTKGDCPKYGTMCICRLKDSSIVDVLFWNSHAKCWKDYENREFFCEWYDVVVWGELPIPPTL